MAKKESSKTSSKKKKRAPLSEDQKRLLDKVSNHVEIYLYERITSIDDVFVISSGLSRRQQPCTTLHFWNNRLTNKGVEILARSMARNQQQGGGAVRHLNLAHSCIHSESAARALVQTSSLQDLRLQGSISIEALEIIADGLAHDSTSTTTRNHSFCLETLHLHQVPTVYPMISVLRKNTSLKKILLHSTSSPNEDDDDDDEEGLSSIGKSLFDNPHMQQNMQWISFKGILLDESFGYAVATAQSLREVQLVACSTRLGFYESLALGLEQSQSLKRLHLIGLPPIPGFVFGDALTVNKTLQDLCLQETPLLDAKPLAAALQQQQQCQHSPRHKSNNNKGSFGLTKLELYGAAFTSSCARALARALLFNTTLQDLKIVSCAHRFDQITIHFLARALQRPQCNLTRLELHNSNNNNNNNRRRSSTAGTRNLNVLCMALQVNARLQYLSIVPCPFPQVLEWSLQYNVTLRNVALAQNQQQQQQMMTRLLSHPTRLKMSS